MSTEPIKYDIQFKPGATRDIEALSTRMQATVLARMKEMSHNLKGDVKRLTNFTPEYRLRADN